MFHFRKKTVVFLYFHLVLALSSVNGREKECDIDCVKAFPSSCLQVANHRSHTGFLIKDKSLVSIEKTGAPDGFSVNTPLLLQFPCHFSGPEHFFYMSHSRPELRSRDPIQLYDTSRGKILQIKSAIHTSGDGSCFFIAQPMDNLQVTTSYRLIVAKTIEPSLRNGFQFAQEIINTCEQISSFEKEKTMYQLPDLSEIVYTDTFRTRSSGPLIAPPLLLARKIAGMETGRFVVTKTERPENGMVHHFSLLVPEICKTPSDCLDLFHDETGRRIPSNNTTAITGEIHIPNGAENTGRGILFSSPCEKQAPSDRVKKIARDVSAFLARVTGCDSCEDDTNSGPAVSAQQIIRDWQLAFALKNSMKLPFPIQNSPSLLGISENDRCGISSLTFSSSLQKKVFIDTIDDQNLPYRPLFEKTNTTGKILSPFSQWFNGDSERFFLSEKKRIQDEILVPAPYIQSIPDGTLPVLLNKPDWDISDLRKKGIE